MLSSSLRSLDSRICEKIVKMLTHTDLVSAMLTLGIKINQQGFACCPLPGHNEKTPSFRARIGSQDGTIQWRCYGCGRGGNYKALRNALGVSGGGEHGAGERVWLPRISQERQTAIETYLALSSEFKAAAGLKRLPRGLSDSIKTFFGQEGMASRLAWYDFVASGADVSLADWHLNMLRSDSCLVGRASVEPVNGIADPASLVDGHGIDFGRTEGGFFSECAAVAARRIRARAADAA